MAVRITATDKIGIVPDGVIPIYCESDFPDEKILAFINLPEEKGDLVAKHTVWQPIEKQRLQ